MNTEKIVAMIPARYAASRFPGKMMALLGGVPVIRRTYDAVLSTALFSEVYVVTDSSEIAEEISSHGGSVIMSVGAHSTGSDRIAEAIAGVPCSIVLNVQGDEPFTRREPLQQLLELFKHDNAREIDAASLMCRITDLRQVSDTNCVKVVTNKDGYALLFSRSPIPYCREQTTQTAYYKHVGIYAFRRETLVKFAATTPTPLETTEKIECLRILETGGRIKMAETTFATISIDSPGDLVAAEQLLRTNK